MENNTVATYNVLWVEDNDDFYLGMKVIAKRDFHIQLDRYDNWDDAEKALRNDFRSYSAVILDAHCKTKATLPPKDTFLSYAKGRIDVISGEYRSEMPWYVFSEGTMNDFNRSIVNIEEGRTEEWGKMLYMKSEKDSYKQMFLNIVNVALNQSNNVVRFRHRDVFSFLGNDGVIDDRARKIMLKILSAMYFPEDNVGFEYMANPLRKVLEYLFRSARKQGLLSPYCFDKDDHVNLTLSSLYLKGDRVTLPSKDLGIEGYIKWDGEEIFSSSVAKIVKNILDYSNVDSHTYEIEDIPFLVEENEKELFFSYVLQLCYVIRWFGEYVRKHPDIKTNELLQMENVKQIANKAESSYEGAKMIVEKDTCGNYHCGECSIFKNVAEKYYGREVVLFDVKREEHNGYKYSAKIRKID